MDLCSIHSDHCPRPREADMNRPRSHDIPPDDILARQAELKKARTAAANSNRERFDDEYADLFPVVKELRANGRSLQAIADDLNDQGHTTRRGRAWNPMQVSRVLKRAA